MLVIILSALLCVCTNEAALNPHPLVYQRLEDGGRYMFNPTPLNWTDANKMCELYNGRLVYPDSMDVANTTWKMMDNYQVDQIHLGFHDVFFEGVYVSLPGKPLNELEFHQWSEGGPSGGTRKNCGSMKRDGLLDIPCSDRHPSICVENRDAGAGNGLHGYTDIKGFGYFKYYTQPLEWPDALKQCYQDGAHLWIINSDEEHVAVFEHFNIVSLSTYIHVGVHHLFADRYFLTIFGEPLESTGFAKWMPFEPSGDWQTFPYVGTRKDGLRIQGTPYGFICEYNTNVTCSRQ